jgi:hypothetical protein
LDSPVFPDRTEQIKTELSLQALINSSPPLLLITKNSWGGLLDALPIIIDLFSLFFIVMSVSQRRGFKWRRVRVRGTGTTVKAIGEATKAHVSVPLSHGVLCVKTSRPLFKGLNLQAFFTLGCNQRTWRLQVQVSPYFFHQFGDFPSFTPLILSLHICSMLGLAHAKDKLKIF